MPSLSVRIQVLSQQLEDRSEGVLGEALFFPEFSCLAGVKGDVGNIVAENVLQQLTLVANDELHRRVPLGEVFPFDVEVILEPVERTVAWREPLTLKLPAIKWSQGDDAVVAYIPALRIEVLANRVVDLPRLIDEQVRGALVRSKAARSLRPLVELARSQRLSLDTTTVEHFVLSPKQQTQDEDSPKKKDESILQKVGVPLSGFGLPQAFEREAEVRLLADTLGGRVSRSALLVGPSGVGKTAIVRELARRTTDFDLGSWRLWSTSGSRLVSGMTGFGMWQERCEELRREVAKQNVILHLGSLTELMEVGKSEYQQQGIASFLRPAIARGEMLVIAECTPEQLSIIERQDVALLRAFQQVPIAEPNVEVGRAILTKVAQANWRTTTELFSLEAIAELDRLHRRFATYSAYPARPIRFLQNLRRDRSSESSASSNAGPVSPREVIRAFSQETGLPLWLLDDNEPMGGSNRYTVSREPHSARCELQSQEGPAASALPLTQEPAKPTLAAVEEWFAGRVIGQREAVTLVVNLLATLKAGLNREHKPLASFLFIGPTGVGKTELAKTLAEYLFGANDRAEHDSRLIRVDMSEYADPRAAQRLIGGTFEAEGVLTARVREQPFAVVLLDEFEKAHPSLFDLLLQLLGEGRLTDAAGRIADFRNCVVIMTSNLGAESFSKGVVGFGADATAIRQSASHFEKAVRDFVRPELFNRIDRIVPFAPLDEATARKVVRRQLELVRQRDGLKFRRVALTYDDAVVEHLLRHGFAPRYGARSLKRVIEETLLAPLSQQINQYAASTALQVSCGVREDKIEIQCIAQSDERGQLRTTVGADAAQLVLVERLRDLRSELQRLQASPVAMQLQNDITRLTQMERRWLKAPTYSQTEIEQRQQLEIRRDWMMRASRVLSDLSGREDEALMLLYADAMTVIPQTFRPQLAEALNVATSELQELLFDLLDFTCESPKRFRLLLVADDATTLRRMARAYLKASQKLSAKLALWQLLPPPGKREPVIEEHWSNETLHWELQEEPRREGCGDVWYLKPRPKKSDLPNVPLLQRELILDPPSYLQRELDGVLGLIVEFSGQRVATHFRGEEGMHRFLHLGKRTQCVVLTALPEVEQYLPPFGIERRGTVTSAIRCRDHDFDQQTLTDSLIKRTINISAAIFESVIVQLLQERHELAARALL